MQHIHAVHHKMNRQQTQLKPEPAGQYPGSKSLSCMQLQRLVHPPAYSSNIVHKFKTV
jgi:hypothetical protein